MKCSLFILFLVGAACAAPEFDRYQSIVDRQPFGPPPPGFDPAVPAAQAKGGGAGGAVGPDGKSMAEVSAEEQKLMSSVRVSVLNVNPAGHVMVGFTDSTTQPPVNYYMKVGETSTDAAKWLVKSADPSTGDVTLGKDGLEVTLHIGDSSNGGKGGAAPRPPQAPANANAVPMPQTLRGMAPRMLGATPNGGGGSLARLRERRRERQAEERAERKRADAERAAIAEKERQQKAEEAAEREEQRNQLMAIQEELKRARELREQQAAERREGPNEND